MVVCRMQSGKMQRGYIRQERPYVTFGILRLGDAVQRWLRHPEPSSWSYKSTTKEKFLYDSCGSSRLRPLQAKIQVKPITKIKNTISIPSARVLDSRPPTLLCGRANNACTNLLGYFVRYVRTRGMDEIAESVRLSTFTLPFAAHTRHALLLATNSCTREEFAKRGERSL